MRLRSQDRREIEEKEDRSEEEETGVIERRVRTRGREGEGI